jgi:hypothetical protein
MLPAGGLMMGMGRTLEIDGGSGFEKNVDFETMRIEQNGSDVIFYARPRSNKEETAFKAIRMGASEVVFENKQHDFPQRVIYRRDGDKLFARIEGDKNGQAAGIDFPMIRANCDVVQPTMKLTTTATGGTCSGKNGLAPVEVSELLKAHNAIRTEYKLPQLTWDCKLAEMAQEWADRGVFEHRTNPQYGESLFVSATSTTKAVTAVQQWMLEKDSWDNKAAACAPGKICTHYTQLVWRKTDHIGCGINRNAQGKWKVLLVCNYEPAGNVGGGPPF